MDGAFFQREMIDCWREKERVRHKVPSKWLGWPLIENASAGKRSEKAWML